MFSFKKACLRVRASTIAYARVFPIRRAYRGRFRIPIIEYGKQQRLLQINNLLRRALCISILRSAIL
jgi:hypothetical protein